MNVFNDVSYGENRAVVGWHRDFFGDHDVGAGAAAGFTDVEIRGVGVAGKDHVAGAVGDAVVGVCYDVVQELEHVNVGIFCG